MDIKDIAKALSTEFRPGDPKHFRLGVWHDGDTLENSSIKISKDLDSGDAFIDILDKKGTGMGTISDIRKHKETFNAIRKHLPPGEYGLKADHPTKAKMYIRDFLGESGFKLSGEKGGAKVLNKKTGKLEHKSFDTLTMTVPNKLKINEGKQTLLEQYKAKILANKQAGKRLRDGIPPSFIATDGKEYRLGNVTQWVDGKVTNPSFIDLARNKEVKASRVNRIKIQTSPNVELFNWKTKPKKMHGHHIRMVQMYAPFYEGLNDKEAKELTEWFVQNKYPLGDAKSNIMLLDEEFHNRIHSWMQEHNIQVKPDKTGKGNFLTINKGARKGQTFVRGGVKGQQDTAVKAVFPTGSIGKTLDQRKEAAKLFLENVQAPIETELSKIRWDQHAKYNPLSEAEFENQLNWLNDSEYASEVKAAKLKPDVVEVGKPLGGLGDTLKVGSKGRTLGRIGRLVAPSALGAGVAVLTGMDVKAREQKAQETGHWLDKLQADIARVEFASDVSGGVAPNPVSETTGFGAGASNLLIDAGRATYRSIKERPDAKQREDLPFRGLPASINQL